MNMFQVKKRGGGIGRVLSIASITAQQGSIMNRYVPGSGVGATSVSARRAKLYRATEKHAAPPSPVFTVPDPPTDSIYLVTSTTANISFVPSTNDGGTPITSYSITYAPETGGTPITVTIPYIDSSTETKFSLIGLTPDTNYTFTIVATNSVGSLLPYSDNFKTSTAISNPRPVPNAPAISLGSKTLTTITLTFTQTDNGSGAIINYKYSINGGATYIAFSPADITSPVTISGLTANTTYNLCLVAVNANGDSESSNVLIVKTYANENYDRFTSVGAATWTAPSGVESVEYLIVGGGGGGGSTYSDIENIGSVPFQATSPGPDQYWINSTAGSFYGYLFKGNNRYTSPNLKPVRLTAPSVIIPNGAVYSYNRWYDFEVVYWWVSNGFPIVSNVVYIQGPISQTYCNNVSAGSGGGSGGYVQTSAIYPLSKYTVVPGTTYNLYVGAGGQGAIGSAGTETNGSPGEASYFDTITASGGLGGYPSRANFNQNGGGGYSSGNIMGGKGGAGGGRNGGAVIASEGYQMNSTILRGTYGGSGAYINFDGTGGISYGAGGDGGDSNVPASSTAPENTGKGGEGTGATLNSYASGRNGASGIVVLKYYT